MRAPILPPKLTHLAGRNQVLYAEDGCYDNEVANRVWFNDLT
jgi:hypothetical protein